jgi:hypothetical protein
VGFLVRKRFALIMLAAAVAACDDGLGPQIWDATPDTFTLFSASRPDLLGHPSGFDFVGLASIRIEQPGAVSAWDIALTGQSALQFTPASGFTGQTSRAGIAVITRQTFETLTTAPDDTAAFTTQPVSIAAGSLLVVRTRRFACGYTTSVNYAKVKVVTADPVTGIATFAVVRNPLCNDRSFVAPKTD